MKYLSLIFLVLIGFNLFVFSSIYEAKHRNDKLDIYFLDVGQGDGALIKLPGGAKVMMDGGPGKQTLVSLYNALPATDRYIDLLILSHPQLDHFGGFIDILKRFKVGAFIYTGRDGASAAWQTLKDILKEQNIKTIVLKEGDSIMQGESIIKFLSPNSQFLSSKELNNTTLVAVLESEGSKTLFTADIGYKDMNAEGYLIKNHSEEIDADILKIAHHGSKYSSSEQFIRVVSPKVSVVSAGEKNRYGHPTKEAIAVVSAADSSLYRTDTDGTIHVNIDGGLIKIYKNK